MNRPEDCLFCGIVAGKIPSQTVDSDERTMSFMDINPATRGHALVVPKRHSTDLMDVDEEDLTASIAAGPPSPAAGKVEVRTVITFLASVDFTVWIALPA